MSICIPLDSVLPQIGDKSRKCALWVKMKPEYSDQTEDMDLIILAAGFANGKMRSGLLSKFLLGVAVPTEEGQPRRDFFALTRVSEGSLVLALLVVVPTG